jgi:uncharacterized protein YozE (UPF0346 family)
MGMKEMKPFYDWLKKQRKRDDLIGDIASDIWRDSKARECPTLSSLDAHIMKLSNSHDVKNVLNARDMAWREYERLPHNNR